MCLIVVKKKNEVLNAPFLFKALRKSAVRNNSGFGFAFKRDNMNLVSKGQENLEEMIEEIKRVGIRKSDELIVHLRNPSPNTTRAGHIVCHPFVVTDDVTVLNQRKEYTHRPVFAHNGRIDSEIIPNHNYTTSDSYLFVKEVLSKKYMVDMMNVLNRKEHYKPIFKRLFRDNKFVIMRPREMVSLFGEFIHDSGLWFSNDTYKDKDHDRDQNESFRLNRRNYQGPADRGHVNRDML